jgi:hypothetical protein
MNRSHTLVATMLLCSCLDRGPAEPARYSAHILDADAKVPSVEDDMLLKMRIASNDAVDEVVPLRTAYAAGRVVRYWDFGPTSSSPEAVWLFRRARSGSDPEDFGHPPLIDSVPGDDDYNAIRAQFLVLVTDAYDGEQIASFRALEDAIELGLVEEPEAMGVAVNWPVVLSGTTLELVDGDAPVDPRTAYYRGRRVLYLPLGGTTEHVGVFPLERGSLPVSNAYVLRRQNELDELDEAVWQLDFNADGDMQDSNLVFAIDAGEAGYSPVFRQVDVTVPSAYEWGTSQAEEDLFEMEEWGLAARPDAVIEYAPTDTLLNRPIRYVAP